MRTLVLTALAAVLALANLGVVAAEPETAPAGKSAAVASADEQAVLRISQALTEAFNRGEAKALASLFLADAELLDEQGNAYRGQEEIAAVFAKFFEKFPGAKMELKVDKIHVASGQLAVVDGTRTVVTQDGKHRATTRYATIYAHRNDQWQIASVRELPAETPLTPHEQLLPLAWLVGEWVNEDPNAAIAITCRWSEDGNFLLADFVAHVTGKKVLTSNQRIGWDGLTQSVHSWVFDSDGGYGDADWTLLDGRWIVKSNAVMPDGTVGSATVVLEPAGKDKFVMKGRDRFLGESSQADFTATIVRKPPQPSK